MNPPGRILVADDEKDIRDLCMEFLELQGYSVRAVENGNKALELLEGESFHLVLSDIMMPDLNGLELASTIRRKYPDTLVILITGHGTIDLAKDAINRGAFDFLTKPFNMDELKRMISRALEVRLRRISDLPSPELKDLYELTVTSSITEQSIDAYLCSLAAGLRRTFRGDASRVYLAGDSSIHKAAESGGGEVLSEDEWMEAAEKACAEGSEVLERSIMAASIPGPDESLGACVIARSKIPAEFTPRDLKLLGLFTAQAGNQLVNSRMTRDLRTQASDLEKANLLAGSFSSSLQTSKVLSAISSGLRQVLQFDLFAVFLSGMDMDPLSYMLVRSDMPDSVLSGGFRRTLTGRMDPDDVRSILESDIRDSFAGTSVPDWDSEPLVEVLDLGDFGSLRGKIVLGGWSGRTICLEGSSHIPILLRHAAAALGNAYLFESSERSYIQTISALAGAVDAKDRYTHNHSRNVAAYVTAIANRMRFPLREVSLLNNASLLHDIGKIGIPESILNKKESLSGDEYETIKTHPEMGYNILRPITAFGSFIDAVRYHHERYDGNGYPEGLSASDIPLHARILALADGFDAMTSDRVYRDAPGLDYAIGEVERHSGSQFDPDVSRVFLSILDSKTPARIIEDYVSMTSSRLSIEHSQ